MRSVDSELEWAVRLSEQLETLSEVAEHLTYRVLELEERLTGQDRQLSALRSASEAFASEIGEAMEDRLQETEDRLVGIERLLHGARQPTTHPRPLRSLPKPLVQSQQPYGADDSEDEAASFENETDEHCPYPKSPHGVEEEVPLVEEAFHDDLLDDSLAS